MKCPKCKTDNPEDSRFCNHCATPLPPSGDISALHTKTLQVPVIELARGSTFAGRYEFIEELGKGGMGRVYKVFDNKIKEEVALKLLNPDIASDERTITRFSNELKFARKISHKNVCRMFDLNEEEGTHYITMEYVPGEDLKSMLRMTKQLSVGTAISLAKQACGGLAEAHKLGVVHRDLKPSNIMIDREGKVRIMDFGIARSAESKGITRAGRMVGTPEYMSPEQVDGVEADQRSDVYSLGAILFEMVTGVQPYDGESSLSIALKHKTEPTPDPRELKEQISKDLSSIIMRCMEKDKEKRYQSAEELLFDLTMIEKGLSSTELEIPKKKTKTEKIDLTRWKKPLLYGASIFLAAVLITLGILYLLGSRGAIDSIAVLPFENIHADPNTEYLSDGITERIISKLAQLPQLKTVIARSSVFQYKGQQIDPQVIGRELGVDAVLVSRMSRRGDELTISVELMRVSDNSHIWGSDYTRNITEIFAVQEEITNSITDELQLSLTGEEIERMTRRYTENSEAFVAYSKGRYFWNKRTEEDLWKAIDYFEEALRLDSNYAHAFTGLSQAYLLLPEYGTYAPNEAYPKVRDNALKALDIDDMLAEAHVSLAQVKWRYEFDVEGAEREYLRAIELDPNYATAHHWYAYDLMCFGRREESIREIRKAHQLDPLSLVINRNLGQVLYRARHYDEATVALQRALEMDSTFSYIHFHLGSIYLQNQRYEDALEELMIEKDLARGWGTHIEAWIGITYAEMGDREKAQEVLDELIGKSDETYVAPTLLAVLYFALGKDDLGFQMLEDALKVYDNWVRLLKVEPIFDRVRSDPRFEDMLRRRGFKE
jgi:serine/threonine protein kinase/Tfp pilus assembly protein PilF